MNPIRSLPALFVFAALLAGVEHLAGAPLVRALTTSGLLMVYIFALLATDRLRFPARFVGRFLIAVALLSASHALAQAATPPALVGGFDLTAYGASTAVFGAFVALLVALVKAHVPKVKGYLALGLSFALSLIGALILSVAGALSDASFTRYAPPLSWLLFGLSSFVVASGGWSAIMAFISARPGPVVLPVHVTSGPVVLHPLDTPGTEPLHDLSGKVIGAVARLTPSLTPAAPVNGLESR